jgi:signal transduction histidine kinase
MAQILNRIFLSIASPELSPREARQSRTLHMIVVACFLSSTFTILCMVILDLTHTFYTGRAYLYFGCYVFVGVTIATVLIERFISRLAANLFFTVMITIGVLLSDSPIQFLAGQSIFFLMLPVILSSLLLRSWAGYVMASIFIVGELVGFAIYHTGIPNITALLLLLILAWIMDYTTSGLEKAVEKELKKSRDLEISEKAIVLQNQRIQEISQNLLEVQERERRLLAAELHDDLGQSLTSLKLSLELIRRAPTSSKRREKINEASDMAVELMNQVRNLSLDLRPAMLDDFGLFAALRWWFERFQARTGIAVHCSHSLESKQRFKPEVESAAFRIIQEALTNVARHACVREAHVELTADSVLLIKVSDQGKGFNVAEVIRPESQSIGLSGMAERVRLLGGHMEIISAPGEGTSIRARIPC